MTSESEAIENPSTPVPELEPQPAVVPEPLAPAQIKRNQHLKVDEPKSEQCTGRATVKEKQRIMLACQKAGCPDIVRLVLKLLDANEKDWFPNVTTK